jgi:RNA polymerase sigma-70 factor, ECF subfamily
MRSNALRLPSLSRTDSGGVRPCVVGQQSQRHPQPARSLSGWPVLAIADFGFDYTSPLPQTPLSLNMRIRFADRASPRMPDTPTFPIEHDTSGLNQLLVDVARGNRAAFESLYRATSSKLFGICMRVLPDRADAEEVLQDVFTGIWNKAGQFDPERASAIAWLAMVARNKAIDRLRSMPARGTLASIELADEIPDSGPSPLRNTEAADDRSRLEACMAQLEPKRQALIRAAFFEDSTYEELANRSASPLGSVKSWIRRGLLQLRGCLES